MKGARTGLKFFGWLYILFAILLILFTVMLFTSQDFFTEVLKNVNYDFKDADPKIVLGIIYGFSALVYLLIGSGLRNVANKKSKGTLLFILLFIAVILGIVGLVTNFSVSTLISVLIDCLMFGMLHVVRNANH